jgi:hypothetical protein
MLTRLRRSLVRKLDPTYYRAALRLAAVDVAIDLQLLLDLRMVGREKFYEIAAQAADETHGDYERVISRTEKLEKLVARSTSPGTKSASRTLSEPSLTASGACSLRVQRDERGGTVLGPCGVCKKHWTRKRSKDEAGICRFCLDALKSRLERSAN